MSNPALLSDRVALVTGATGLLGPVWSEALLEAGARVAGLDLPSAEVSAGFAQLQEKHGDRLVLVRGDVCARESLEKARESIEGKLGPVEILVNNAGIDQPPGVPAKTFRIEDIPEENFRRVLDVNTFGLFQACQVFGEGMVSRGGGAIINIGSLYAEVSPDERFYDHMEVDPPFLKPPAYGASKAAVINLTKYLAAHWGKSGVRVNALSPGGVQGPQDPAFREKFCSRVPLGRMARHRDLVGPLLFLASEASSYVTGINLVVDGGYTSW
jgi:NAD(P)-dependent dehydrogenase (short-subunit alcohol dehydrogenase family)